MRTSDPPPPSQAFSSLKGANLKHLTGCDGSGSVQCPKCRGDGEFFGVTVDGPRGVTCRTCFGTGRVVCFVCELLPPRSNNR
jgi:DnaJ-class molecular chaperone